MGVEWNCALMGWPDRGDLIGGLGAGPIGWAGNEPEREGWVGWGGCIFGYALPPRLEVRMFSIIIRGFCPCIGIFCG